jgi:hypothetical protein
MGSSLTTVSKHITLRVKMLDCVEIMRDKGRKIVE